MIITSSGTTLNKEFTIQCNLIEFLRLKEALEILLRSNHEEFLGEERKYFELMRNELGK